MIFILAGLVAAIIGALIQVVFSFTPETWSVLYGMVVMMIYTIVRDIANHLKEVNRIN